MKKKWKKIMAACCAAAMLVTMPGVSVPAGEIQENELFVTEAEVPEAAEEFVGEGTVQVGEGVTATFDADTGAVEFYSNGGTLATNWLNSLGAAKNEIISIRVASGTVCLPEDASYTFSGLESLTSLDLTGFDASKVTRATGLFEDCSSLTVLDLKGFAMPSAKNMQRMLLICSACFPNAAVLKLWICQDLIRPMLRT